MEKNRLAEAIKKKVREGSTHEQLARQLGVSRQTLWHWCLGTKWPATKRLATLARKLGISVTALLQRPTGLPR